MKVLISHPDFKDPGGVANYYRKLRNKFRVPVENFVIGRRPTERGTNSKVWRMWRDYGRFARCLKSEQYDLVHVNPSLDFKSFLRDGIFLLIARKYRISTLVFFRGWQKSFEQTLARNGLWLLKLLYGKANAIIVLSEDFKKVLRTWGFTQPIYREVTIVDDDDLAGFDVHQTLLERERAQKWRVLFLARLVKQKGIYETIEAVSLLQQRYPTLELVVAGDGAELAGAKSLVRERSIPNVTFTGYAAGREKYRLFERVHIFCFPSYYGEGMPNAVAEAMAFGLPVVTRPVGGIADFFQNGVHGFATHSKEPKILADLLERLRADKKLYRDISLHNYHYAQSHFLASRAAERLEQIYNSIQKVELDAEKNSNTRPEEKLIRKA